MSVTSASDGRISRVKTSGSGFSCVRSHSTVSRARLALAAPTLRRASGRSIASSVAASSSKATSTSSPTKAQCLVVGFNLFFDLPRLAVRGRAMRGSPTAADSRSRCGTTRTMTARGARTSYRPRLAAQESRQQGAADALHRPAASATRGLRVRRSCPDGQTKRHAFGGHFLDLHTLAFALSQPELLASPRRARRSALSTARVEAEEHGVITPEYIDYNRRDVKATGELLVKLLDEFERAPDPAAGHEGLLARVDRQGLPADAWASSRRSRGRRTSRATCSATR